MTPDQYLIESARTVSPEFHLKDAPTSLNLILDEALEIGRAVDDVKKTLFYGSDRFHSNRMGDIVKPEVLEEEYELLEPYKDLLHVALGLVSESAEFLEGVLHLASAANMENWERVEQLQLNLKEEMGDQLWYIAEGLRQLGLTFEEVMDANIRKLKARYPQKFTQEDAENRDLEAEVAALR